MLGPADRPALEEPLPAEHRMRGAQRGQPGRELGEHLVVAGVVPVDPADLVVLGVDVVVAALGAAQLVAVGDHRHALGQQQRGDEVALLPLPQRVDLAVVGRPLDAVVPRPVVALPVARCPRRWPRCASRCRRRGRARVNPSWAVTKLIEARGRRPSASYRSELPVNREANSPRLAGSPRQKSRTVSR